MSTPSGVAPIRVVVCDDQDLVRTGFVTIIDNPAKVVIVTTFNLDALVFDALRAGASGFLLKDARPVELLDAIRTVAAGESLLSPTVTRTLIAEGLSNAEIALALVISHETVKPYVSRILSKLDLRDRVQDDADHTPERPRGPAG
ncbi:response regulator transcription factor [Microbacterium sp. AK031]|uniref:LuxR C-terminal-related transcriptional regulator n=1 Tax=Microbacterium sp. AK031 TaxID=2723076 RepID=UPI00216781CB|nr:response regulator transcription factor [Microbacterium sp. AK031]MCS3842500.1 DNA-binding NarL/FixJ family response regulator [Microbacterium sp. AK031]